jgi:nucleoside 2-deoxyribosyltransferase
MWEVGYAMALERPTIVVTQAINELPFDIRDMQALQYDRTRLNGTLGEPLRKMIVDTMSLKSVLSARSNQDDLGRATAFRNGRA